MAAATRRRSSRGWADQLTGAPSDLVHADASCSGGDPLALCAGAIVAFPATSGARRCGAAAGFTPIAVAGGAIPIAAGTTAAVSGAIIRTGHDAFIVTQECIFAPLIPLYIAGALAAPMGRGRRVAIRALMHKAAQQWGHDPDRFSYVHAVRVIRRDIITHGGVPPFDAESVPPTGA